MRNIFFIIIISVIINSCEETDLTRYSTQSVDEYQLNDSIPIPTLYGGKFIESPGYGLNWTTSGEGYQYQLVSSYTDSFPSQSNVYQGTDRNFTVSTNDFYYRVRAYYAGYASRWSNVVKP